MNYIQKRLRLYLRTFLWRIYLPIFIAGLLAFCLYKLEKEKYKKFAVHTTFMPSAEGGGGIDMQNPLSMFLGNGGGGSGGGGDMIVLMKSRMLAQKVLRDTVIFQGEKKLFADLILEQKPKPGTIAKIQKSIMGWFSSSKEAEASAAPTLDQKVLSASNYVINSLLIDTKVGEDAQLGLIVMTATHQNPELIKLLSNRYIEKITEHYQQQKTEKSRKNYEFYVRRTDSIKRELDRSMFKGAKYQDQNKFRIFAQDEVPVQKETGNTAILQGMYTQVIGLREAALNDLLKETPVIKVLDKPEIPELVSAPSPALKAAIGVILGLVLGTVLALFKLILEDLWKYLQSASEEGNAKSEYE